MSKMKSFQVIALTLSMLMIISMVKGRWLDLETYSTSMISVGVHNISNENPPNLRLEISNSSTFYAEKRCESLYGFFPCANTMLENVFLMFIYMYFMILGDEWTRIGSKVLFQWIGDRAFGESVFGVLKALPRIAVFVAPGVLSSASDAQNQVGFGVSMYAGSTVITLTLIWGIRIILSRYKYKEGSSDETGHQQDSSIKCLSSLKQKLPFETDKEFTIDKKTGDMAVNMLLSLIPFAFVGLLHFINTTAMTLFALIVSVVALLIYFGYQVQNSWIRYRSLAYLNEENLRARFFYHVVRLADFEDVVDKQGDFDFTCFRRNFDEADKDKDGHISHNVDNNFTKSLQCAYKFCGGGYPSEANVDNNKDEHISHNVDDNKDEHISHNVDNNKGKHKSRNDNNGDDELGDLVQKMFMLKREDEKSKESAKAAILMHFDMNNDKKISWYEFQRSCSKWIKEAISSGPVFGIMWNQVKEKAKTPRKIEQIMPRILKQVLEKHGLVKEDGEPDREKIEGLFSQLAKNPDDHVIHGDDLKEFIKNRDFGIALDHDDKVLDELVKDFDLDGNQLVDKNEFVDGFIKRIEKATDPKKAIEKFEEDWGEIHTLLKPEKPKATIVYAIFGIAITIAITSPFIISVRQFSAAAHIPFLFTSFVMAPIAMKAKMVIVLLLNALHGARKNASLTFSEIYDQLVMDNLIGIVSLLLVVYIRGLSWTYSSDVLAIVIPCAIVGLFAFKRDHNYPLWASFLAILLYPVSVCIYYVCKHWLIN